MTEGEKKAAKAVQEGVSCVDLQGVWSWADAATGAADKEAGLPLSAETAPVAAVLDLASQFRRVLIVGDSDLLTNPVAGAGLRMLEKRLGEELAGILTWIVEGAKAYYVGGLPEHAESRNMKSKLQLAGDTLQQFLNARTRNQISSEVQSSVIYNDYRESMRQQGQSNVISSQGFASEMGQKGYSRRKDAKGNQVWQRLRLQLVAESALVPPEKHNRTCDVDCHRPEALLCAVGQRALVQTAPAVG